MSHHLIVVSIENKNNFYSRREFSTRRQQFVLILQKCSVIYTQPIKENSTEINYAVLRNRQNESPILTCRFEIFGIQNSLPLHPYYFLSRQDKLCELFETTSSRTTMASFVSFPSMTRLAVCCRWLMARKTDLATLWSNADERCMSYTAAVVCFFIHADVFQ